MDELLALVGQHWRLVLIYPGGLTALVALLPVTAVDLGASGRIKPLGSRTLVVAIAAFLTISMLPLPQSNWPYPLDLVTFVLLIELPFWLWLLHAPGATRAAIPLLSVYPLLALAIAALGQGAGSLVLREINRSSGWLHWLGIGAWAVVLPPLLHLGPWRCDRPPGIAVALRRLAHVGLILAAALPANDTTPLLASLIGFVGVIAPLAALNRWWRGDGQSWLAWQPWLVAALTLLLAAYSAQQFALRLR